MKNPNPRTKVQVQVENQSKSRKAKNMQNQTIYTSTYSSSGSSSTSSSSDSSSDGDDDTYQYSEGGDTLESEGGETLETNEGGTYEEEETTLDDNTYDDTIDTNETNTNRHPIDWTAEIGNMLTEHTTQIRERISGEIDKLTRSVDDEGGENRNKPRSVIESLPDIGQKVQEQLSQVLSPLARGKEKCSTLECTSVGDQRDDEEDVYNEDVLPFGKDGKENDLSQERGMMTHRVQSILKSPQTSRFPQKNKMVNPFPTRLETIPDDSHTASGSIDNASQQTFHADWSQCSAESDSQKVARELREAKDEIASLKNELKELSRQKQNVESQLDFAKLALESLSHSHSGSFSQIESAHMPSLCQTLEISEGAVGIRGPKKLLKRSRILRRR